MADTSTAPANPCNALKVVIPAPDERARATESATSPTIPTAYISAA